MKSIDFINFNKRITYNALENYLKTRDKNFLEFFSELVEKNNIHSINDFLAYENQNVKVVEELKDNKIESSTSKQVRINIYKRLQKKVNENNVDGILTELNAIIKQNKEKDYSKLKYPKEIIEQRSEMLDSRLGNVYEYIGSKTELIGQQGLCFDLFPSKNKQGKKYNIYENIFNR